MKLILFTSSYPYGKSEQFLETEIKFLSNKFKTITIIPTTYGNEVNKRKTPANVDVFDPVLPSKSKRFLNFKFLSLLGFEKIIIKEFLRAIRHFKLPFLISSLNIAYLALGNKKIKAILDDSTNEDILYFYWGHGLSFILPFIRKVKAKKVFRVHRGDLYEDLYNNYFPFRSNQLSVCDYVIPISNDGCLYLKKKYPDYYKKIKLFRLGVHSHEKLSPSRDCHSLNIVSCSALISVKRVNLIIETLKTGIKGKVNWIHFGDGELMHDLKNQAKSLPPNIDYRFRGFVPNSSLLKHYCENQTDLFINVSFSEGIPVSIMEAMSYGIPVIATDVGGASEAITRDNGILLDRDFEINELRKSINLILDKKIIFDRMQVKESWREMFDASNNYNSFTNFLFKLKV